MHNWHNISKPTSILKKNFFNQHLCKIPNKMYFAILYEQI